ncbi:MAG: hypothetical protein J7M27_03605 [Candidatus Latescibacteria bacterium]|nr:hypothetical protein [Candidatus Latescibacterota bacterium]
MSPLEELFSRINCSMKIQWGRYDGSHLVDRLAEPWDAASGEAVEVPFNKAKWRCRIQAHEVPERKEAIDLIARFEVIEGAASQSNVGITFAFNDWSADNYVLMPGAVYNGNRFESRKMEYSPRFTDAADLDPDVPTIVSDIPRLNCREDRSEIQLLARDMATPAIGFHAPNTSLGFWCLTDEHTEQGPVGMFIRESEDRKQCEITITSPGVREDVRYTICNTQYPSEDRGVDLRAGDKVVLRMRLFGFDCPEIQSLYDHFVAIRKDLTGAVRLRNELPFSAALKILEEKYNRDNWKEDKGFYAVGIGERPCFIWQIGWVGGMIATCPLILGGDEISRQRALRNFDFVFPKGQCASGFFRSTGDGECWYSDHYTWPHNRYPESVNRHLIRKSADALYFILKQFGLFQSLRPTVEPKPAWVEGTRKCADAFVRLWKRTGQFGQFVDTETGDIIVGNSTSASMAPAGLALAGHYYHSDEYLEVAIAAGCYFYENFVKRGLTTGGPGDCLQCPDSESAFGLLESFVVLYEVTGDEAWIKKARDMAHQCATWVTSYDFDFPPESLFGRLGMSATGSVWANAQNKHAAPGICTLSGSSLFKLFRATGDLFYLELIQEIAHNLPQYLSRSDRPIGGMPSGWMNERVNLSDWLEGVGEIFHGSCWSEVSTMLTCVELPGLYIQPDTALVCAFDNIDAEIVENTNNKLTVKITNPTKFEASVHILVENSNATQNNLGQDYMLNCSQMLLPPISSRKLEFMK